MRTNNILSISLRFGGDSDSDYDTSDDGPPEGTEVGGDGEPIPPGESDPYPSGG